MILFWERFTFKFSAFFSASPQDFWSAPSAYGEHIFTKLKTLCYEEGQGDEDAA